MRYTTHVLLSEVGEEAARANIGREKRDPFGVDHTCCWCTVFTSPARPASHRHQHAHTPTANPNRSKDIKTGVEIELRELSPDSSSRASSSRASGASEGAQQAPQQQPWTTMQSLPSLPKPPQAHLPTRRLPTLPAIPRHSLDLKIPHLIPNRSATSTPKLPQPTA